MHINHQSGLFAFFGRGFAHTFEQILFIRVNRCSNNYNNYLCCSYLGILKGKRPPFRLTLTRFTQKCLCLSSLLLEIVLCKVPLSLKWGNDKADITDKASLTTLYKNWRCFSIFKIKFSQNEPRVVLFPSCSIQNNSFLHVFIAQG